MANTELYLFRHAESEKNRQAHLISGRSNETPLTLRGIGQGKNLGRFLCAHNVIPSRVYSSPAVRAIQTATYALSEMGLTIEPIIDEALQEMDQGAWVDRLRDEVYQGEVLVEIVRLGKDFKAPGGESMNEVGARMLGWAESIVTNKAPDESERIFAFSHGVAIRCFASTLCNWTQDETYQAVTDNTSMSLFIEQNGQWRLAYLGRMPNLESS